MTTDADVIVVGAGPAGLSAALVLGRACRSVLVFDHGQPRNARARIVHGLFSRAAIPPDELLRIAREDLQPYGNVRLERAEVLQAVARDGGGFQVALGDGRSFASRKLLLATGVVDTLPNVPGLQEMFGCSVFHCPYCDGWEVRDQPLAVYGCGRRGYGLSLELLGWSQDVVLCADGSSELDLPQLKTLARNHIRIMEDRIARLEGRDGVLERIVFVNGESLPRRALFFTTGQTQATRLAQSMGCAFNEKGTVRTGRYESTDVPGLYVAGDASRDVQWVVVAAAEGAEAAYAISQELIKEAWR
jgi:thioredoxin reductase